MDLKDFQIELEGWEAVKFWKRSGSLDFSSTGKIEARVLVGMELNEVVLQNWLAKN